MSFANLQKQVVGICIIVLLSIATSFPAGVLPLKRQVAPKPVYEYLPPRHNTNEIVFKLREGMGQPVFDGQKFQRSGAQWIKLNSLISSQQKAVHVAPKLQIEKSVLDQMRSAGSARTGIELPDLTLYYKLTLPNTATPQEKLDKVAALNKLDIIEIAYFSPEPILAQMPAIEPATPGWESSQYYLQAAPTGIDAYYAWNNPGGKGEGVKVVDIEGNWVESHEDLHGGTDSWHIAGSKIEDPEWYMHGTAVLGEIAADSNNFGMTGIAFNVDLGTVSIGSMELDNALVTATANSDTGDIFLIELQYGGPNNGAYVPAEYYQANFDAILTASSVGRIVVEAGANGGQDLDDTTWYGQLFNPNYRFSGAIMVAASDNTHHPASFTSHGQRLDVHAFGTWDVYTLGYGDLYGSDTTNYYTSSFSGTSSASPIIVGACAVLQGVHKAVHGRVLDHNEMRNLLTTYSTPQAPHPWLIGPLPDLQGSVDEIIGVSFTADTTIGWVPFDVSFIASSGLSVDTWTWDFGDGDSAFVQSPVHTYASQGLYSVKLEIDAGGDVRSMEKQNYIIALADSMLAFDTSGSPGGTVEVPLHIRNTVPIRYIKIPVEYGGTLDLSLDSFSTAGCLTDYFAIQQFIHSDNNNKRKTIILQTATNGTQPDLPTSEGDLIKLYFKISPTSTTGQTATITLDGYLSYTPEFNGPLLAYQPKTNPQATISICQPRGDMDGSTGVTVSDITYLVDYLFNGGPAPNPLETGDVNCTGGINIEDLTYLVAYLFGGGSAPCGC